MDIPKKLQEEIWQYCMANNITNVDDFMYKMLVNGFNVEKYGNAPFAHNIEPEVIEKEVIKEVEKIVEKEVIKEVPVEVIKEVEKIVEKEVYVTDDETITDLTHKISDLEEKLELEIKTSNAQVEINKELDEVKNSLFDELEKKKEELDEAIEDWGADVTTLSNNLESTIEENNKETKKLKKEITKLKNQLEKKTDDKYKKFWEDEIEAHDKTKEEINVLKETINQLKGNTNNDDDIYGSDEKGWWSGGSNLIGKK